MVILKGLVEFHYERKIDHLHDLLLEDNIGTNVVIIDGLFGNGFQSKNLLRI